MWYVLQVRTGTEENIRTQCRNNIPEAVLTRCFIPYYEEKRRIRGTWTVVKKVLFPGYVFAVTDRPDDLYQSLKHVIGLTKLIGTGQEIVPLTEEEKNFLEELGGREQIVAMSEGIIEGDQVVGTGQLDRMTYTGTYKNITCHIFGTFALTFQTYRLR